MEGNEEQMASDTLVSLVFACISLPIAIYDLRQRRIPIGLCVLGLGLMLAVVAIFDLSGLDRRASGALLYSATLQLARCVTKGKLGSGDVKFGVLAGFFLQGTSALSGLGISVALAFAWIRIRVLFGGNPAQPIPFAPFIATGAGIARLLEGANLVAIP
jgi:prepilin signal peptidase PulO-like enzyme (type II secretory pathway)